MEKILPVDLKRTYPVCIGGKRAAPPEDCGGALAYLQMWQDLKYRALFGQGWDHDLDFDDEDDEEWPPGDRPFDPDAFSRRSVNARLRQYARGDREWLFSD